jgi:DNA polymerase-3 subunit beta
VKLTIRQPNLAAALAPAGLCSANPRHPVGAAVLLDADQGLTVRASDLDQWASATASADVMEPGQVAVSGRLLREVVKVIPKTAEVHLEAGDTLAVRVDKPRGSWSLPVIDHELFPVAPAVEDKLGVVDGPSLAEALGRLLPFVTAEEALANIHAIYLHAGAQLVLVATDRYRLAVAELDWQPLAEAELYVPLAGAKAWADLAKTSASVTLAAAAGPASLAALEGDAMVVASRLGADYPQWRVLDKPPDDYPTTAVVDVAEVQRAVAGVLAVAEAARKGARDAILFAVDGDGLRLAGSGRGSSTQDAAVLAFNGDPVRLGVDPSKLAAALAALGAPQAVLSMHSKGMRPILFRPATNGAAQPGYRHILMPMRPPEVGR